MTLARRTLNGFLRRSYVANLYVDGLTLAAQKTHARFQRYPESCWLVCTREGEIFITRDGMPSEQVEIIVAREPKSLMGEEYTRTYPLEFVLRDLRTQRERYCVRPERVAA